MHLNLFQMRDGKLRTDIAKVLVERSMSDPNKSRVLAAIDKCQNADQGIVIALIG